MASLFNSKHNKYVSIPDWFKDVKPVEEQKIETKTTYIGGGGVSSSGLSNITIYNKFVLKDAELDNEALIIKDIALNGIETEEHKIGDEIPAIGWNTTEYTSIAGSSTMTVTSTIIENQYRFGVFFYDNALSHISNVVLQNAIEEVIVPVNAYYFRISVPANDESFNVRYNISEAYNSEQLSLSDKNVTDYLTLNDLIPEGKNETVVSGNSLKLLVQSPLSLTKDINNVVKLSIGNTIKESSNDMFVWDKKLAAFGYDSKTGTAYSYVGGEQQFTTDSQGNQVPVITNNPEFWMYDETLSDKWIIRAVKPKLSLLDGLMEYDSEKDCFMFHKNIVTSGSVTMYADLGDIDIDDLYSGLVTDGTIVRNAYGAFGIPIDNKTIVLDNGKLVALGGSTGGGVASEIAWSNIKGKPSWLEDGTVSYDDIVGQHDFVTKTDDQTIIGIKDFQNGIKINNLSITNSQSDVIYIDANLVVRGGITMYAVDPVTVPSIIDSLPPASTSQKGVASFNSEYFSVDNGHVTLIPENIGLNRDELNSILDSKGYATQSQITTQINELRQYVTKNYVTITGEDTITGKKNFTGGLFVNNHQIVYDTDGEYWKLDGNLLVTGGITMYGDEYQSGGDSGQGLTETQVRSLIESYNFITLNDIRTATATDKGIASFGSTDFDISDGHVTLKTHIHIGTSSTYNNNTLYIIA